MWQLPTLPMSCTLLDPRTKEALSLGPLDKALMGDQAKATLLRLGGCYRISGDRSVRTRSLPTFPACRDKSMLGVAFCWAARVPALHTLAGGDDSVGT